MPLDAVAIVRGAFIGEEIRYGAYHPACAVDVEPSFARWAMLTREAPSNEWTASPLVGDGPFEPGYEIEFDGKAALVELASRRMKARTQLESEAAARRVRKVVEGGTRRKHNSEIALDRKGRPRVTVLWAQIGSDHLPGTDDRDSIMPDRSFASSLREYVFEDAGKRPPVELPWQPVIGGLIVAATQSKVTRRVLERLLQWRSFSFAAPVLWIVGPAGAPRDAAEQQLRALLDEAGFAADEARCVASEHFDEGALGALGAALDEGLSIEAPAARVADPRENILDTLEQVVREGRTAGYASALALCTKRLRGMSSEMKARAADSALAALAFEPAARHALALLAKQPHNRGADLLCATLHRWLAASRTVSKLHEQLWAYLELRAIDERFDTLTALIEAEHKPSPRCERWLELLTTSSREKDADWLEAFSNAAESSDPRARTAKFAARSVRARARREARELEAIRVAAAKKKKASQKTSKPRAH